MSESSNINKYVERHKRKLAKVPEHINPFTGKYIHKEQVETHSVVWFMRDNHVLLLSRIQDSQQIWEPIIGTYYESDGCQNSSQLVPIVFDTVREKVGVAIDLNGLICTPYRLINEDLLNDRKWWDTPNWKRQPLETYKSYHFVVQRWSEELKNMHPELHPQMQWFPIDALPETLVGVCCEALEEIVKKGIYSVEQLAPDSYVLINKAELKLQPLCIPAGFKVTYNQFYGVLDKGKPIIVADIPEAHWWMYEYYHNRLLTLEYKSDGILIEIGWYPEADPQGSFGIEVVDLNSEKRWDNFLQFDSAEKEIILKKLYEYITLTVDGTIRNYRESNT